MWARAEGVRQWIANVLPKTSLTTLRTEHMCAQILDSYAKCGYICSLDYTQAFDHVRPELALHCLHRLGCHPHLIGTLKSQWTNQLRWVTWNHYVAEEPMPVQCGIPQGDPMSPIALIALIEAGRLFILSHVDVPPHHHTIYMDDRSWTPRNPADLLNVLVQWRRFSAMTGLKESHGKTQVSATSRQITRISQVQSMTALSSWDLSHKMVLGKCMIVKLNGSEMVTKLFNEFHFFLEAELFVWSSACRIFAVSKASYGWLTKKINVQDSKKFDTAVRRAAKGFAKK